MGFTQEIIRLLNNEPTEGFQHIAKECKETVIKMYEDAAKEEMEWAEYLFKDGAMLGINAEILILYMKWLTNSRMKAIALEPIFPKVQNPINWIRNWTESKDVQVANQESESQAYIVGAFTQDMDSTDFSKFDF